jgi:molybdenum cofactor biosynthesis protein MoaC
MAPANAPDDDIVARIFCCGANVKVYAFEEIDESLKLLPLAARRALDVVGVKVSLAAWQTLSQGVRRELAQLGCAPLVNVDAVKALLDRTGVVREEIEVVPEPAAHEVPAALLEALGPGRPLAPAAWVALNPLDRYALAKVAARGREQRLERAYREIIGASGVSSHLAASGDVRMVDVSAKEPTRRRAVAQSSVTMSEVAFAALAGRSTDKGDVLATARVAGIMAAKRTADIIPLCHPLSLTHCEVKLELSPEEQRVAITASAEVIARTGVEMEAMMAATAAALTVYDMLKGLDRSMIVGPTRLMQKSGGKSGDFKR